MLWEDLPRVLVLPSPSQLQWLGSRMFGWDSIPKPDTEIRGKLAAQVATLFCRTYLLRTKLFENETNIIDDILIECGPALADQLHRLDHRAKVLPHVVLAVIDQKVSATGISNIYDPEHRAWINALPHPPIQTWSINLSPLWQKLYAEHP